MIAAETRLYRDGLVELLTRSAGDQVSIVGTAGDASQCVAQAVEQAPDVVVLDTALPESVYVARAVRNATPSAKIVVFAITERSVGIGDYAEAGVTGYVLSDASIDELLDAVVRAAQGDTILSPRLAAELLRHIAAPSQRDRIYFETHLTAREREVSQLIEEGLSNKQIASQLRIELATAKNHVHNILGKLQVSRRAEAAAVLRNHRSLALQDPDQ